MSTKCTINEHIIAARREERMEVAMNIMPA
jgi:hypothetical protein